MSTAEEFVKRVDKKVADWYPAMVKKLDKIPALNETNYADREFYERHKAKAEEWAAMGDPHYIAALAVTAPQEAQRFAKIAKEVAAEDAARNYGRDFA